MCVNQSLNAVQFIFMQNSKVKNLVMKGMNPLSLTRLLCNICACICLKIKPVILYILLRILDLLKEHKYIHLKYLDYRRSLYFLVVLNG